MRPGLDAERVRAVHRQLAEVLLALRGVPLDSFGSLDASGRPVGMPLVEALHRRAEERVADDGSRALLHELLDRDAGCFDGVRPGLVHDDLHHGNVVLAESGGSWRITGVLDWEKAWAGSAESDVARMAFWDGMTGPGFWEVYRAAVPEDDGFAHRALLHQLAWCFEYPVSTARHDRDTAAVCAALGVAPPSRFRGR
ncbi:phosphotransferase [Geodermatophilus sp. SYSU D00691]